MTSRVLLPSPRLKQIVEYYFHHVESFNKTTFDSLYSTPVLECLAFNFRSGEPSEKMQYGGRTVELTGNVHLFGQPLSPVDMAGKYDDFIVVKFKPLGIWKLTGISMQHIANQIIQAEDIFGTSVRRLVERMQEMKSTEQKIECLDHFLLEQLGDDTMQSHPCMGPALALLAKHQGNIGIRELQEQTNTTRKTMERAFALQLGLSPKLYAKILRYNFAKSNIEKLASIDWGKIVHEHGYYDQSHFINEFKMFSGKTPVEYYKNRIIDSNDWSVLLDPRVLSSKA